MFGGNLEFPTTTPRAPADLEGPQQGLHVQPLHRDLDASSRRCATAAGTRPAIRHARRAHPDRQRPRRVGPVHPARSTDTDVELFTPPATPGGAGTLKMIGSIGDDPKKPPSASCIRACSRWPSGRTYSPGPDPDTSWYFAERRRQPASRGATSATCRAGAPGARPSRCPAGPSGPTQAAGARRDRLQRQPVDEHHGDLRRGATRRGLAGRAVEPDRPRPREHRAAAGRLDGRGRRRTRQRPADLDRPPLHYADEPENARSSCGTRHDGSGRSAPRRPSTAPTTRPRCCCPTAA